MNLGQLILEYCKVLLAWPPVALIMLCLTFRSFHKPLSELIGRLQKADILGQKFEAADALAQKQKLVSGSPLGGEGEYAGDGECFESEEANESKDAEVVIPPELIMYQSAAQDIEYARSHPEDTVKAYRMLEERFLNERVFNIIYGTQVLILVYLNAQVADLTPMSKLEEYYSEYLRRGGKASYSVAEYIAFMCNYGLINVSSKPDGLAYAITERGKRFLIYIQ